MTYQIATHEITGALYVVLTMNGGKTIARIVHKCDDRADADQLLRDLAGWRF